MDCFGCEEKDTGKDNFRGNGKEETGLRTVSCIHRSWVASAGRVPTHWVEAIG